MIARYTRPKLAALWSEARKLQTMLDVELAACEALEAAAQSPIPAGTTLALRQRVRESPPLDPARIAAIEEQTQHDVLAFLIHVEERLGAEARYLHFGLTSSDILDTTTAILLCAAIDEILKPRGVAVLIEAEHTCMSVRGVAKHGAMTFTSRYTGMFRDNPAEQSRFLTMVRAPQR